MNVLKDAQFYDIEIEFVSHMQERISFMRNASPFREYLISDKSQSIGREFTSQLKK